MEITVLSATWWALQAFLVYFRLEGAGKRWEAATSGTQVEYDAILPDNNRTTSAWWTLNTTHAIVPGQQRRPFRIAGSRFAVHMFECAGGAAMCVLVS